MKFSLNRGTKIFLLILFLVASIIGFMLKLPSVFRNNDKELHSAFYFLAAAFLNFLFIGKNIIWHVLLFAALFLLGIGIEHAQEYSNTFFHKKIHGRYDPQDVAANLKGLIAFSAVWVIYVGCMFIFKKVADKTPNT